MKGNHKDDKQDDFNGNRLFLTTLLQLGYNVKQLQMKKPNLYLLTCQDDQKFMLKGFHQSFRLYRQVMLLTALNNHCPEHFIPFIPFTNGKWDLKLGAYYFGKMPFINGRSLNFGMKKERMKGYERMKSFHTIQEKLDSSIRQLFSKQSLYKKWHERYFSFMYQVVPVFPSYRSLFKTISAWSIDGLNRIDRKKLEAAEEEAKKNETLIHGDVAHHNFIVQRNEHVKLFDFDLVKIAPHVYDDLQYITRIMPSVHWQIESLEEFKNPFLLKQEFLRMLVYPSDLLREWNYCIRLNRVQQQKFLPLLVDYTERQIHERQAFLRSIK